MRPDLVNDMNPLKTRRAKMPRVYIYFFLGVSLVIATIFIPGQLIYVASGHITWNLLLFNLTMFTVIFLLIIGTSYLLVRRAVLRQMEYKLNLEEAKAFTESILDSLPDIYHSFDLEGRPLKWNKAAREVTGYSDEEIASMSPADFVSEEDRNKLESTMAEALGGGRGPSYEAAVVTKDGRRIPFEFGGSLLTDQDGNVIGFGAIGRDITGRRRAEEAVRESEEKYRSLFRSSLDGIVVVGLEGKIVDANRAYLDMLGYTFDEIREISYEQLTPKKWYTEEMKIIMDQVLERGYSEEYEKESTRKDGTVIPVSIRRWLITNDDGNPIAMCAVTHDITERRRAEEELKESEENLQVIFDTVPALVFYKDRENNFIRVNKATADSMDFSVDEIEGKSAFDFFPQEQAEAYLRDDLEVIESGVPKMGIIEPMEIPEGTMWLRTDKVPYRDAGGEILGIIGFAVDITERKRAEEELQKINAELEGYAHTVSHDLKGPLTSISLAVDMLGESVEDLKSGSMESIEMVDEIVSTLGRNAEKAHRRIKDLLSLAESGQVPGDVSPVDVAELVEEILDECSPALRENGIEVHVPPNLGTITGNPTQIQQVFSNLIGNAIRYNDSENPVVWISYLGDDEGGTHRYLVCDNGPGIPEDIIDDVFLPFIKGMDGDTGIGLSIVERIVKVYGGEIRAYNDDGVCFEFTLRDF